MATKTTNYALTKPEANDYYNVNDFNSNADIIDAELKKLASGKADLDESGKIPAAQLPSAVTVDSEINTESENPVQNKVIAAKLAKKADLDEAGKVKSTQLPEMNYAKPDLSNVSEAVFAEKVAATGVRGATAHTATLATSGWTLGSDERYYQAVSVEGVTTNAAQVIVVDPALTGTDLDADAAVLEAWQEPSAHNVTQGDGTLTFYSYDIPAVNIPINVGVA